MVHTSIRNMYRVCIACVGFLMATVHPVRAERLLVVLVPGMYQDSSSWRSLIERLQRDIPELAPARADWVPFDRPLKTMSRLQMRALGSDLEAHIDAKWHQNGSTKVILIGHSVGGLLVRQAYLLASAADPLDRRQ